MTTYDKCACGNHKNQRANVCLACYKASVKKETRFEDIWPPPNWLSYTPKNGGRYVIDATWGYSEGRSWNCQGTFFITDTLDGQAVKTKKSSVKAAPGIREQLVAEVKRMNRAA